MKDNKQNLIKALKSLSSFRIKENENKIDLQMTNPGWQESEDEYKKSQKEWLDRVAKKKK